MEEGERVAILNRVVVKDLGGKVIFEEKKKKT